jgi:hypothetical protein
VSGILISCRQARFAVTLFSALSAAQAVASAPSPTDPSVRFGEIVDVSAANLAPFHGLPLERLGLYACVRGACRPIPLQIDERDPQGHWVIDRGPGAGSDTPPATLDGNDHLLFMAADAGKRVQRADLPGRFPVVEVRVHDPLQSSTRWAYLVAFAEAAPRSTTTYVRYDPASDSVRGARVTLGFRGGIPSQLGLHGDHLQDDLLDRFKVRATASFFWGLLRFSRSEDDVSSEFLGWREGPIRVIRAAQHRVRLGWGIRSPTFGSYVYVHRDFARLPVSLRLNFKATFFFSGIDIRTVLDFRDLRGWGVLVPGIPGLLPVDGQTSAAEEHVGSLADPWFALLGPHITLVQSMRVSPSLQSMRRRLYYRDAPAGAEPPEEFAGELPGIGYRMDGWEKVGPGAHWFEALSYALPVGVDVHDFMDARRVPLQVGVAEAR